MLEYCTPSASEPRLTVLNISVNLAAGRGTRRQGPGKKIETRDRKAETEVVGQETERQGQIFKDV